MTHISLFATMHSYAHSNSNEMNEYQVEVVTSYGDSEIVTVEAHNESEASEKAAEMVGNADYTIVY